MKNTAKCIDLINELSADALLLCDEANMHYLCSFSPSEGMILITKDGGAYHLVDSRYTETAQNHSKETGLSVIEIEKNFFDELKILAEKHNIESLVFENETISYARFNKIKDTLENTEFINLDDKLMRIRNRKDAGEIELLKKANAIAEKSFFELLNYVEEGKTEKELEAQFNYLMAKNGSDGLSFDTILLSGPRTSMPHGIPSDRRLKKGEFVLFDFGATYRGYHSDMTRTVALGSADNEMREMYYLVLKAQLAGIDALKAGVRCKDVYQAAWDVLNEKNMAQYFRHGLGHGVGLEIHEGFNSSPRSEDTYEVGNVTSVEPGIYLPDKFGIRIEDVCVVTESGNMNISTINKELLIL
ncbi:MAG: aminopeptidase P family protein [Eubacterium sp.]|nr:aminopeptidase P family protein [Eubacterium sp.]